MKFSLRDVFWFTLVLGMGAGWWAQSRQLGARALRQEERAEYAEYLVGYTQRRLEDKIAEYRNLVETAAEHGLECGPSSRGYEWRWKGATVSK